MFIDNLKQEIDEQKQLTENGAIGYISSGEHILDFNFKLSSYRNMTDGNIRRDFIKVYGENPLTAVKFLFFVRDVRSGCGERRTFRVCMNYIVNNYPEVAIAVAKLIPEYGRYDDLLIFVDSNIKDTIIDIVKKQLEEDINHYKNGEPISLLAKWMYSEGSSSNETKRLARLFAKELGLSSKEYRCTLSKLRKYIKVVEVDMSSKNWQNIDYSAVPSRANLVYNNAFLRNDEERRREYLEKLKNGDSDVKINAGVLFPSDIVNQYYGLSHYDMKYDETLEQLWKALPDYVNGNSNTIVVADGSGSMTYRIGKTTMTAWHVATSLAIYFSERCKGQFKDKYITFSSRPQLVDFSKAKSLRDKIKIAASHNECANTNIAKTFRLILNTGINNNLSQEEMPENVLILSDMEFDCMTTIDDQSLFRMLEDEFNEAGYRMPRCIFWNIMSRTGTLPVNTHEDFPVALVSGFSPSIMNMVLSNNLDPLGCLLEQVNSDRYQPVEDALKEVL